MTNLLILVTLSRLMGRLAKSLGYLEIIGEIVAGLLLGPALLAVVEPSRELAGIVELGVFLLIFSAGLEMDLHEIFDALKKKAIFCAAIGFILPLSAGLGAGLLFNLGPFQSITIGLCVAITALPVVIRFSESVNLTDTPVGNTIMGSAIIIDVVALLVLGILFDAPQTRSLATIVKTIGLTSIKMLLFFSLIIGVNAILRRNIKHVQRSKRLFNLLIDRAGEEAIFGFAVLFVLVFSTASEAMGFHFIIGAFFGGLILNKDIIGKQSFGQLSHTLNSISSGFLTPVFFAYIGLQFSVEAFDSIYLLAAIIIMGFGTKFTGAWIGARLTGFSKLDASKIGIVLNSRGVLDLVVADLAHERGYIDSGVFSVLVILGISSVIINPVIYRKFIPGSELTNENGAMPKSV